jgi:hypothetical protein
VYGVLGADAVLRWQVPASQRARNLADATRQEAGQQGRRRLHLMREYDIIKMHVTLIVAIIIAVLWLRHSLMPSYGWIFVVLVAAISFAKGDWRR